MGKKDVFVALPKVPETTHGRRSTSCLEEGEYE
jgi:hypothetical protein